MVRERRQERSEGMVQDGYFGCEEFLHRLPRLLDGEHHPAEEALLHDHLAWCEKCLRKYRFERTVLDEIRRKLRGVPLPDGLRDRVQSLLALAAPDAGGEAP